MHPLLANLDTKDHLLKNKHQKYRMEEKLNGRQRQR